RAPRGGSRRRGRRSSTARRQGRSPADLRERRGQVRSLAARHRRGGARRFAIHAARDTAKGNRPSFTSAASPEEAEPLYEAFCAALRELGVEVATGVFGAR